MSHSNQRSRYHALDRHIWPNGRGHGSTAITCAALFRCTVEPHARDPRVARPIDADLRVSPQPHLHEGVGVLNGAFADRMQDDNMSPPVQVAGPKSVAPPPWRATATSREAPNAAAGATP